MTQRHPIATPAEETVSVEEDPASLTEGELLAAGARVNSCDSPTAGGASSSSTSFHTPPPRPSRKFTRLLTTVIPRQWLPAAYFAFHAAMFVAVLFSNRVVPPSSLLTSLVGRVMSLLFSATLLVFLWLLHADPGYIRSKREHRRGDPGVRGVCLEDSASLPTCRVCCCIQPARSRHCNWCERCVYTYDHHCWWLDRCVAGGNKPEFMGFLMLQTCVVSGTAMILLASLAWPLELRDCVIFPALVVTLLVLMWNVQLLWFHCILVGRNQTSLEFLRPAQCQYIASTTSLPLCCQRRHFFFSRGLLRNLYTFAVTRPVHWVVQDYAIAPHKRCRKKGCSNRDGVPVFP